MKKILIAAVVLLLLGAAAVYFFPRPQERTVLRIYTGAGLRLAVDKLTAAFEKQTGIQVEPDYGGSGVILSRAQEDPHADLFLPGDAWYVDQLQARSGRVVQRAPVAVFVPVLIVAKGNPRQIQGLSDLARSDVRVGLGKRDVTQVGRVSEAILRRVGVDLSARPPKESLTVNELGVWVKLRDVDVAIVWDAIAANVADDVEVIQIPPEQNMLSDVVAARLSTSRYPEAAEKFLEFLGSDEAHRILEENGYHVTAPK